MFSALLLLRSTSLLDVEAHVWPSLEFLYDKADLVMAKFVFVSPVRSLIAGFLLFSGRRCPSSVAQFRCCDILSEQTPGR